MIIRFPNRGTDHFNFFLTENGLGLTQGSGDFPENGGRHYFPLLQHSAQGSENHSEEPHAQIRDG